MAVLAGIVPAHAVVGKGAALAAHSKRELVRRDRMANRRPNLAAAMHGRQGLYGHMHDAGNFRRAALAADGVFDRHFLHAEMFADQRRKGRHGTTLGAAEDRAERCGLLFIGALIDIGCKRPVAVSHGARRMANDCNVEPIQRYLAVVALVDVEDERNVTYALARPRRQRRAGRDEAWAHHVAVTVLEIIARQVPLLLCRHIFPLFGREKDQGYYCFALITSRLE